MAVAVHLKGHHFVITDDLRRYVERKLGRLDRFLPSLHELTVELTHQAHARNAAARFVAEATVPAPGAILRAEERAASPQAAIDAVTDRLERQIERFKSKLYANLGRYERWRQPLGNNPPAPRATTE